MLRSDMLARMNAMAAQLDAVLQPERCDEAAERMERERPCARLDAFWVESTETAEGWLASVAECVAFFQHPERIQITRMEVHP